MTDEEMADVLKEKALLKNEIMALQFVIEQAASTSPDVLNFFRSLINQLKSANPKSSNYFEFLSKAYPAYRQMPKNDGKTQTIQPDIDCEIIRFRRGQTQNASGEKDFPKTTFNNRRETLLIDENKQIGNTIQSTGNTLYADAINNREFYNVSEISGDLSTYELTLTGKTTATFKVCKAAEKRVIARPGNLNGCETDIVQGGKILETVSDGRASESGGKWKVDVPLKLKIT